MHPTPKDTLYELEKLRQRANALERLVAHHNMSESTRREYVAIHDKADHVARCFGDSAPRWNPGESQTDYRKRLVNDFKKFSPRWSKVDFLAQRGSPHILNRLLEKAEVEVFADAVAASRASFKPGVLKEVTEVDPSGRRISRFVGDPSVTWEPFKMPPLLARIAKPTSFGSR